MYYHLVPLREGFLTVLALVRPGVRVNPLVLAKKIAALEVLGAVHALKRSLAWKKKAYSRFDSCAKFPVLTCVGATNVQQQLRSPHEGRAAGLANVGLLSGVSASLKINTSRQLKFVGNQTRKLTCARPCFPSAKMSFRRTRS